MELPPCDYQFEIKTSDRFGAGTSAKPYLTLYGDEGNTGRLELVAEADNPT